MDTRKNNKVIICVLLNVSTIKYLIILCSSFNIIDMDLTLPIVGALYAFGYYINDGVKTPRSQEEKRKEVIPENKPSSTSVYHSDRSKIIKAQERRLLDERFDDSKMKDSKIFSNIYNSKTYNESRHIASVPFEKEKFEVKSQLFKQPRFLREGKNENTLSGQNLVMSHNNMKPFLKGGVKQNTDIGANEGLLERFTGVPNGNTSQKKKEVPNMFTPKPQDIHGLKSILDESRFNSEDTKRNLLPLPQVKVPFIDGTSLRPRFKDIDELRVNKRDIQEGRIIQGQNASATSRINTGLYSKQTTKSFYENEGRELRVNSDITKSSMLNDNHRVNKHNVAEEEYTLANAISLYKKGRVQPELLDSISTGISTKIVTDPMNQVFSGQIRNAGATVDKHNFLERQGHVIHETERMTIPAFSLNPANNTGQGLNLVENFTAPDTVKQGTLFSYTGNGMSEVSKPKSYDTEYQGGIRETLPDTHQEYRPIANATSEGIFNQSSQRSTDVDTQRSRTASTDDYRITQKQGPKVSSGSTSRNFQMSDKIFDSGYLRAPGATEGKFSGVSHIGKQNTNDSRIQIAEEDNKGRFNSLFIDQLKSNPYSTNILK
jgi:hypothetical protein